MEEQYWSLLAMLIVCCVPYTSGTSWLSSSASTPDEWDSHRQRAFHYLNSCNQFWSSSLAAASCDKSWSNEWLPTQLIDRTGQQPALAGHSANTRWDLTSQITCDLASAASTTVWPKRSPRRCSGKFWIRQHSQQSGLRRVWLSCAIEEENARAWTCVFVYVAVVCLCYFDVVWWQNAGEIA